MIKKTIQRALKFACGVVVTDQNGQQKQYEYKVQCKQTSQFGMTILIQNAQGTQMPIPIQFFKSVSQLLHGQKLIQLQIQQSQEQIEQKKQRQQSRPRLGGLVSMGGAPLPPLSYTASPQPKRGLAPVAAQRDRQVQQVEQEQAVQGNIVQTTPRPSFNPFGPPISNMMNDNHQAPSLQSLQNMALMAASTDGETISAFISKPVQPVAPSVPVAPLKKMPSASQMISARSTAQSRAANLKQKLKIKRSDNG